MKLAGAICGECLVRPPPFQLTFAPFIYEKPISRFITQLKFHHQLLYANLMGVILAKKIKTFYLQNRIKLPDCIVPVPLHYQRQKQRGFNQALEIARPAKKKLKLPINSKLCQRSIYTKAQSELNHKQRIKNIKGCFLINTKQTEKINSIAIVDDVITTGNTVTELAKQFKRAGVEEIHVWSVARTKV